MSTPSDPRSPAPSSASARLREIVEIARELAFKAGFVAGVSCVDKFGEAMDTPDEAYAEWRAKEKP